ncbi:MAG: Lrp/AsnC ligand binding domain-containing protein, partial [Lentisphaeria bacterium]|nr:Lrp/AsnC ligand binding domain-containing protein [Lentisphaeria bacterium]
IEVRVRPEREGGFDRIARRLSNFPQVTALYLMSGGYDLMLEVRGADLNEVASFVSSKLATIDGVLSTATHFLLKKYKESGVMLLEEEHDERLKIVP